MARHRFRASYATALDRSVGLCGLGHSLDYRSVLREVSLNSWGAALILGVDQLRAAGEGEGCECRCWIGLVKRRW